MLFSPLFRCSDTWVAPQSVQLYGRYTTYVCKYRVSANEKEKQLEYGQ